MRKILIVILAGFLCGCAVKPMDLGFNQQHWDQLGKVKQEALLAQYKAMKQTKLVLGEPIAGSAINIEISRGLVMMPPFVKFSNYRPVSFILFANQCQKVRLMALAGKQTVKLMACYYKNILSLDGSQYDMSKRTGTLFIHYNPLWHGGFTYYGMVSQGYVRLKQVNVRVKTQPNRLLKAS